MYTVEQKSVFVSAFADARILDETRRFLFDDEQQSSSTSFFYLLW
jgi:hypothetical protein